MSGTGVRRSDALATLWVVAAVGFYVVNLIVAVPGFGSPRPVAALLLVLGSFACGAGADLAAFTEHGVTTPAVAALRVGGVVVLIVGVTAVITGSATTVAALATGIGVMWLATTIRHLNNAVARTNEAEPAVERVPTPVGR